MFGTFSRSWQLLKQSLWVLKKDKELLLFPVLSGLASILILVSFFAPLFFLNLFDKGLLFYAWLFLFYLANYFVVVFFNSALVAAVHLRLSGGDPTVSYGISEASKHLSAIIGWVVIAATVGLVLRLLRSRNNILQNLVLGVIGFAWHLVTYFVVPVLVIEGKGPIASIKRSASIIRGTWGEAIVGGLGIGAAFFGLFLLGIVLVFLGSIFLAPIFVLTPIFGGIISFIIIVLAVLYFVLIFLVASVAGTIFNTALYHYAVKKQAPLGFSKEQLDSAFKKEGSGRTVPGII